MINHLPFSTSIKLINLPSSSSSGGGGGGGPGERANLKWKR